MSGVTGLPLTTTFIPDGFCTTETSQISIDDLCNSATDSSCVYYHLGPADFDDDCLPASYSIDATYLPGICPRGYVTACSKVALDNGLANTIATCCPSGYSCQTENGPPWYSSNACTSQMSKKELVTYEYSSDGEYQTATTSTMIGINAYGIIVLNGREFSSTPQATSSSSSSSSAAKLSTSRMTGTLPTATAKPTTGADDNSGDGLSSGAKVGLGVGLGVGLSLLALGALLFILWRRRTAKAAAAAGGLGATEGAGPKDDKTELPALSVQQPAYAGPWEAPATAATAAVAEMPAVNVVAGPAELSSEYR